MKTHARRIGGAAALAVAFALALGQRDARAANGTLHTSTLTFADSTTASLSFTVRTDIAKDADGTSVQLEFAPDGNNAALGGEPFPTPAAVSFSLSYNGAAVTGFSCTAQQAVAGCLATPGTQGTPNVSILLNKQPASFGRYALTISYPGAGGSTGLTGPWVLGISGIPTSPSSIRGNASIINGTFQATLTPTGACGGGATACPAGQSCKGPCTTTNICVLHPPICEIAWEPVWFNWPPNGPPCLSCPVQWQGPFGEEFERVILNFTALGKGGLALGAGRAKEIQLHIEGGRPIGELTDMGGSQYAMMIESRKGEPSPRITANIAGAAAPTFIAGSTAAAPSPTSPLPAILVVLLVLALAVIAFLARRASGGATRQ